MNAVSELFHVGQCPSCHQGWLILQSNLASQDIYAHCEECEMGFIAPGDLMPPSCVVPGGNSGTREAREVIASEKSWVPSKAGLDSAEQYVETYLSAPDAWWWSTNDYAPEEIESVLKRTLAIIDLAKLPIHENALGQLGVGPLENMMSDDLLDILRHSLPFSAAMCKALYCVRSEVQPVAVQAMIFR
jgi:hypothetical protein